MAFDDVDWEKALAAGPTPKAETVVEAESVKKPKSSKRKAKPKAKAYSIFRFFNL